MMRKTNSGGNNTKSIVNSS